MSDYDRIVLRIKEQEKYDKIVLHSFDVDMLPDEIYNLSHIETWEINLPIIKLSPKISNLVNLKKLFLLRTQLESLPNEIETLTNLTVLDISGSLFREVPKQIFGMNNLVRLVLSNSKISHIPEGIYHLPNLLCLELIGTKVILNAQMLSMLSRLKKILITKKNLDLSIDDIEKYDNLMILK